MSIGGMRHKVDIYNPPPVGGDGRGGTSGSYTRAERDVPVSLRHVTTFERDAAARVENVVSHIVRMRYTPNINHASQLRFGSRVLEVVQIDNKDERDVWLDVWTLEGPPQQ